MGKPCRVCGTKSSSVKLCSGCAQEYYCGRDCQKKDWKAHKRLCKTSQLVVNLLGKAKKQAEAKGSKPPPALDSDEALGKREYELAMEAHSSTEIMEHLRAAIAFKYPPAAVALADIHLGDRFPLYKSHKKIFQIVPKIQFNKLRDMALAGDPDAMMWLGECYFQAWKTSPDDVLATQWYRQSALAGGVLGQYNYGMCLELGYGVRKDLEEALRWFRLAADNGWSEAICQVGFFIEQGMGNAPRDHHLLGPLYKRAAEMLHPQSQYGYGNCLLCGWGVQEDQEAGIKMYVKSALQGFKMAEDALERLSKTGMEAAVVGWQVYQDAMAEFRARQQLEETKQVQPKKERGNNKKKKKKGRKPN